MKYLSFASLSNKGRLGNQMFQVASTLGLAEKHSLTPVFPSWQYGLYFKKPLPNSCANGEMFKTVKEKHFHWHEWEFPDTNHNIDLDGYLQSEKYFGSVNPFQWADSLLKSVKAKYGFIFNRETLCVQIRRGDFVGNKNYYQLPVTYYIQAITSFKNWQDLNIVFISDDLPWCQLHFGCLGNAVFPSGSEVEHMCLGSLCDNIIISNSTFGWWTAWLGEHIGMKKIVHPGYVFDGNLSHQDTKDFWPQRWTRFQKESYNLNLTDITFTIPVLYDHRDRKQNLDLSVCILQTYCNTNIIVGEQGGEVFKYMSKWCDYISFPYKEFHRTKMLNDMAMSAETPFVANWDCDVIIPPMQLQLTAYMLRQGADMVYPYGGNFIRLSRDYFKTLESTRDIGSVAKSPEVVRKTAENSVGGAVFFNRRSFIEGGMENEYMISFAPEDVERYERFQILGYTIERTGGNLFHINHFIGKDSSKRNPHFYPNHAELEKERHMSGEELLSYIDTWPWRKENEDHYLDAYLQVLEMRLSLYGNNKTKTI